MAKENEIKEAKGIIVPIVWAFIVFMMVAGASISYALSRGGNMLAGIFIILSIMIFFTGFLAISKIYSGEKEKKD